MPETEYETYNGEWCVDCLMMWANGQGPCETSGSTTPCDGGDDCPDTVHALAMEQQWPMADGWNTSGTCPEDCEGWFSMSSCDGCGSTLGGDRHPFVAMRKIQ
jgi:hypothetical protein